MKLEEQLATLSDLGLTLADGITIEDLLYTFDRREYESKPFDLVLFVLGIEVERPPWGRTMCEHVWNFDLECISASGDYAPFVDRLVGLADAKERVTDVCDYVDLEAGEAWLKYTIDGTDRNWEVEVNDDWADAMTVNYVMDDIESEGKHFYFKDNGQAMVLFYLDDLKAAKLNNLSGNSIRRVLAE